MTPATDQRAERRLAVGLFAGGAALSLPYALAGPGIVLDDWFTLWWGWRDGVWRAAGSTQGRARPVGALVYDLQYGVIGPHPLVWLAFQTIVTALSAVLLFRVLRRFLPSLPAAAVAAVWLLSANHSTLDHWGAGSLAGIALLLLLAGSAALLRGTERSAATTTWLGVALLALSPLVYEATLPASGLAAVFLPWIAGHGFGVRASALRAVPLAAVAAWLVTGSYHLREDQGWFEVSRTLDALFGTGIGRWTTPGAVLFVIGVLGCLAAAAGLVSPLARRLVPARSARLIAAGLGVAAVGYVPFLRYPISPLGVGDRANVVAAVGGAMVWVGIGWALERHRAMLWPVAATFGVVLMAARVGRATDWAAAGDDSRHILAVTADRVRSAPPGRLFVVGPPPKGHRGIIGLTGTIEPAIQYTLRDTTRRATVAITEAEWAAAPPDRKIDLSAPRPPPA
jgi:hypothetical protein